MHELSEQELVRRNSLNELRQLGIDPFPAAEFVVSHTSKSLREGFLTPETPGFEHLSLAGRIMSERIMGKASFVELQDADGRIQIYIARDSICPDEDKTLYNTVFKKLLDIGDFIGVRGHAFYTQTGELSVHATELVVLGKSLRPLPIVKEKDGKVFDAFADPEQRYRQRYVDLIVNPQVKETFIKRTRVVNAMRQYFNERGYLEVDTPTLQAIPGGATARPFTTHLNALNIPLYLRIANELYLKRLIVGGFDGVYEFSRNFRNEGMDRTHNPEFTAMEIYVAYKDYIWMMNFTEGLLERIALEVNGTTTAMIGDKEIDFKPPYRRVPILEAIREHTGHDLDGKTDDQIRDIARSLGLEVDTTMGRGKLIDTIFGEMCEHHYVQPTFITDYPKEMSPLTKSHRSKPGLTERFELMVAGKEIANAYSELNDPIDQLDRFQDQLRLKEAGDDEAMFIDHDFIRALEYGMPPTSGMGIGIDRLVMFLTNSPSIQDVLFFPMMRPEKKAEQAKPEDFVALGVPADWAEHLVRAGYQSPEALRAAKATQVHQQLNGYRKKNKLDLPALQLDQVQAWLGEA